MLERVKPLLIFCVFAMATCEAKADDAPTGSPAFLIGDFGPIPQQYVSPSTFSSRRLPTTAQRTPPKLLKTIMVQPDCDSDKIPGQKSAVLEPVHNTNIQVLCPYGQNGEIRTIFQRRDGSSTPNKIVSVTAKPPVDKRNIIRANWMVDGYTQIERKPNLDGQLPAPVITPPGISPSFSLDTESPDKDQDGK